MTKTLREAEDWISPPRGATSWGGWLGSQAEAAQTAFLDSLNANALAAMPYLFDLWALAHQRPPQGEWPVWLILAGRGAGKTRAGAEWVRAQVEGATPLAAGKRRRLALLAETVEQAREVMVFGESGVMAATPPDRKPDWVATRKALVWPNGAEARLFSAVDPESLRGPQFDGAWCDELAKWPRAQEAWDMLQFGLRLGDRPQVVATTTPRAAPLLIGLLDDPRTVVTRAPTQANAANLSAAFIEEVERRYAGGMLGRQEIGGELLLDRPGALWTRAMIEAARVSAAPAFERVVVAVDPPATSGAAADACGIVVAALSGGAVYVIADASVQGVSPRAWAEAAVAAARAHNADRIVAEINQGGEMVEAVIRQVDPQASFRALRASRGKAARAEPVAALYEQGRVKHLGAFPALEDELCALGLPGPSPDRADALVWAVFELLLSGANAPRLRKL